MSFQELSKEIGSVERLEATPGRHGHIGSFLDLVYACRHFPPHAVVMKKVPLDDALFTLWYISASQRVYAVDAELSVYKFNSVYSS